MTVICIETSTSVCSAAICVDGRLIKQCICLEGSNHARLLPLYIDQLLQFAKEQHLSIDAVALSEGPGSYTGLRIGTSTAKGLCYGLNVPLIPVPTLQVLSAAAKEKGAIGLLCPMIDARRMEVYTSLYDANLQPLSDVKAVVVENEESFSEAVFQCKRSFSANGLSAERSYHEVIYFGDGAKKCTAVFTKPNWHYLPDIVPESRFLATLLGPILDNTKGDNVSTSHQLAYYEPFYLKEFIAAQSHVKGLK